ncbi:hypothetical protein [Lysinibacillus sphaericus]|nr:hypothetical protein [Lysinibacillus sphaericus]
MSKQHEKQLLSPELPFEKVLELVQPMITSIFLKCIFTKILTIIDILLQ